VCFLNPYIPIERILCPELTELSLFVRNIRNAYKLKPRPRCLSRNVFKAIYLTRDKMKRRAFHLRSLIGKIKNKKARQDVIEEYVSLISQMSQNN